MHLHLTLQVGKIKLSIKAPAETVLLICLFLR